MRAGYVANNIAKWNGSAWLPLDSGVQGPNARISAMATIGTNILAAGGFTTADGIVASSIARWDGNTWSALGSGIGGYSPYINALAMSGTNLFAGGWFTAPGLPPANGVAKWNGSGWSGLGSGVEGKDSYVLALAASGTDLYAGGRFTMMGGVWANYIAKWDGSTWSALGEGLNGWVYALAVSGSNLYAGGQFTTAGGVQAHCLAKWDGDSWSALGAAIPGGGAVRAIVVDGDDIYVGRGDEGGSYGSVAKWDGSTWSALGSAMNGPVYALAGSGTNLFAAGHFTSVGEVPANNIAKWDGSTWSALGSGILGEYPQVYALAANGGDLYAGGGGFTNAGGVLVTNLAKWDGNTWSTMGSGMGGESRYVYALLADGTGHLFVGGNFSLAGNTVSPYIVQGNIGGEFLTILVQPQSQTVALGTTIDLAVIAAGSPAPAFQWYFNVTNSLTDATNAELRLDNLRFSDSGIYSVVITNAYGAVTSAPALLTAVDAPVILSSPTNTAVQVGAAIDFSVKAVGTPPLAYQWFFNETSPIGGGTNSVLRFPSAQYSQSGSYTVVITNVYGAVTSPPAILRVVPPGTVTVCTEAALRAALDTGEPVTFACDGTISLTHTITISRDTLIDGSGQHVAINGGGTVRVFYLNTNVNFKIVNLTIEHGASTNGAGIYNNGGRLILQDATFQDNLTTPLIYVFECGGGALFNRFGVVNATNCAFLENSVTAEGAGSYSSPIPLVGGAILNSSGVVTLDSCVFNGNSAGGAGGALYNKGTAVASRCNFLQNSAYSAGIMTGTFNLAGAGTSHSGGAIYNSGSLLIDGSSFIDNSTTGSAGAEGPVGDLAGPGEESLGGGWGGTGAGGAVCNSGSLVVQNSLFVGNAASGGAGGSGAVGSYQGDLGQTRWGAGIGGLGGDGAGGALYNYGTASLLNSTIVSNVGSGGSGGNGGGDGGCGGSGCGGIYGMSGHLWITNCTIALNSAFRGSGGAGGQGGSPGQPGVTGMAAGGLQMSGGMVVNTILASNAPGGNYSGPSSTDAGHNISSDDSCAFTNAGSLNNTDPMLGPLADNGGPTWTMALLPGSPAIDAGDDAAAPPTDQRGFRRPFGAGVDIGAYEYGSVVVASPPPSQTAEMLSAFDLCVETDVYPGSHISGSSMVSPSVMPAQTPACT